MVVPVMFTVIVNIMITLCNDKAQIEDLVMKPLLNQTNTNIINTPWYKLCHLRLQIIFIRTQNSVECKQVIRLASDDVIWLWHLPNMYYVHLTIQTTLVNTHSATQTQKIAFTALLLHVYQ